MSLEDKLASSKMLRHSLVTEQNTIDTRIATLRHRKAILPALILEAEADIEKFTKTILGREKRADVAKALAEIEKLNARIQKLEKKVKTT